MQGITLKIGVVINLVVEAMKVTRPADRRSSPLLGKLNFFYAYYNASRFPL
jgi:hypothetical protein